MHPLPIGISSRDGNLHLPDNSRLENPKNSQPIPFDRKAVFLDRDGVINEDIGYLSSWKQLIFLDGVTSAIRRLQNHFYIIVITNQSGIARGYFSQDNLLQVHSHMLLHLRQNEAFLDALYFCPHYPQGSIKPFNIECKCRKPLPGMLLRARLDWDLDLAGSFMVGDQPRDVEAAKNVGATGILLEKANESDKKEYLSARNLSEAADLILKSRRLPKTLIKHGEANE